MMLKVSNKKAISNLSRKTMGANKMRNVIAAIAIALTTMMFATLFTVGMTEIRTMENSTCLQVGNTSHGGFENITRKEYEQLKKSLLIKEGSYNIFLGIGTNKATSKVSTELRYAQDLNAKWYFSYPETGTMPKDYQDVAMPDTVLDMLGVPHKVGEKIELEYTCNGKEYKDTFKLSGFWKANEAAMAQEIWLSKDYVIDKTGNVTENFYQSGGDCSMSSGYLNYDINFSNSWNIEKKMNRVLSDAGYTDKQIKAGINWAYTGSDVDTATIGMVIALLLLILVSGYLIIFNVFYISVAKDVRYYGLLKTIGTTGKQIGTLVRKQALKIAFCGIPIGLAAGYMIGRMIAPLVMNQLSFSGDIIISMNPLIFIGAAVFSLITTLISCMRPQRMAAKVSPIEALCHSDADGDTKKPRIRKTGKISAFSMARKNVFRNKKKVIVVVFSLSMSIMLLQSIYTVVNGFDMDAYLKESIITDFDVSNSALKTRYELSYVDQDTTQMVDSLMGNKGTGKVYMSEAFKTVSDAEMTAFERIAGGAEVEGESSETGTANDMVSLGMENIKTNNKNSEHIFGVNKEAYDYLNLGNGKTTYEEFEKSGKVMAYNQSEIFGIDPMYQPEDSITVDFSNNGSGEEKTYDVMRDEILPYCVGCRHSHGMEQVVIMPESEYLKQAKETEPMRLIFNADKESMSRIERQLSTYCDTTDIAYTSKATLAQVFESNQNMYKIIGVMLIVILAIIGLMNFANTEITSIMSRSREHAMLQSVGMTARQLKKILIAEGMIYCIATMIVALTLGSFLSKGIVTLVAGQVWYFTYHFTIVPILICLPVLVIITYLVPALVYRNISKKTVVERLQLTD